MKSKTLLFLALLLGIPGFSSHAQSIRDAGTPQSAAGTDLPLKKLALFSSGVGYFEHSGTAAANAEIVLPFDAAAVNDALKSLVVNDPAAVSPSVRYASEDTLIRTLKSLRIDLSGRPGIGEILNSLKGAELEIAAPSSIKGRILGVESRNGNTLTDGRVSREEWLSLFSAQGVRAIAIKDIASFRFTDERINTDINRALDLIMASRDEDARNLLVSLGGGESRAVSLSYVVPVPVWKVSYRLDLGGASPFLQGWAIVDNDSDTDWKNVELSLVIGRPVSFIQNLYPPLRLSRPVLPLSIAGIAESRTYDSGYGMAAAPAAAEMAMDDSVYEERAMGLSTAKRYALAPSGSIPAQAVTGGVAVTANAGSAGDQFEFTLKDPVTLERRQSAMLPLVEGTVRAEKTLVFSGSRAAGGAAINPGISAELTNTSGMKLPAGPITVYDGGIYAGDALIEFFPESEKRLISYGEDLSVTGNLTSSGTRYTTGATISDGVMVIQRRQTYEKEYTIRNASAEEKKIIIEHPITGSAELVEPKSAEDRTASLYRFSRSLPAKGLLTFKVREEAPISERVTLSNLTDQNFLSYASNQEIPANARNALNRAIELKNALSNAMNTSESIVEYYDRLSTEQERIRANLTAAGNQSPQGQEYLRRLAAMDSEIEEVLRRYDESEREVKRTEQEYSDYLAAIKL